MSASPKRLTGSPKTSPLRTMEMPTIGSWKVQLPLKEVRLGGLTPGLSACSRWLSSSEPAGISTPSGEPVVSRMLVVLGLAGLMA